MNHATSLTGDIQPLTEVVAQALFNAQFPMRTWQTAKRYLRKTFVKRAEKALTLSGFAGANLVKEKR